MYDICSSPRKFVSVEPGNEIVLSYDGGTLKLNTGVSGGVGHGLSIGRRLCTEIFERILGLESPERKKTAVFGRKEYND